MKKFNVVLGSWFLVLGGCHSDEPEGFLEEAVEHVTIDRFCVPGLPAWMDKECNVDVGVRIPFNKATDDTTIVPLNLLEVRTGNSTTTIDPNSESLITLTGLTASGSVVSAQSFSVTRSGTNYSIADPYQAESWLANQGTAVTEINVDFKVGQYQPVVGMNSVLVDMYYGSAHISTAGEIWTENSACGSVGTLLSEAACDGGN